MPSLRTTPLRLAPLLLALALAPAALAQPPLSLKSAVETSARVQSVGGSLIGYLDQLAGEGALAARKAVAARIASEIAAGVKSHPEYAAASADTVFSAEAEKEAQAAWLPQVSGRSSLGYQRDNGATTRDPVLGIGVNQLVYDFGAAGARIDAARSQSRATQASARAKQDELLYRAVRAWHELYRARRLLELHRLNATARREIADFVQERAELGGSAQSDVLRARARQADAEAGVAGAESRAATAEAAWLEAVGTPAPGQVEIGVSGVIEPRGYADVAALARRFPPVLAADAGQAAAEREADAARAARWPRLSLDLASSKQVGGTGTAADDRSALLQFQYNLYTGGAATAKAGQAQARAVKAAADAANERRQAEKSLRQALAEATAGQRMVAARRDSVGVAAESMKAVREQFAFRRGTLLDLLRAQEDLFNAGKDLVDARVDTALAGYRLLYLASELEAGLAGTGR